MELTVTEIKRVIAHEVVRSSLLDSIERPPKYSDQLAPLEDKAKELVRTRLADTVASGGGCVEVSAGKSDAGSPFDMATRMLDAKDADFIKNSIELARMLSKAQTSGAIRSGSVLFVQGECFVEKDEMRFLAIIKADPDKALFKRVEKDKITLSFVNDMLLADSQRLLKIAFFLESIDSHRDKERREQRPRAEADFSIRVFDHLMKSYGIGQAADYFYRSFLQCEIANNSSILTLKFMELTGSFIDEYGESSSEKFELLNSLKAYVRQNQGTLDPAEFARLVLPDDIGKIYVKRCKAAGLTGAFIKNIELVRSKLKREIIKFSSKVTISGSSEDLREAIQIAGHSRDGWTTIKIRGSIESMK